ncbi:MAG: hypothetical protein ACXVQ7_06165, partial [Actinomycetota bacterium]
IAERLYDAVDTERNERLLRKLQDDERGTKAELSRLRVAAAMRDGGWEYALRVTKTAGKLRGQIARASFFQKWRFIDTLNVRVVVPEDPAQPLALELAVPSRPGERDGERINLPDMPDWHVRVLDELALPVGLVEGDTGSFQTIFDKVVGMFS